MAIPEKFYQPWSEIDPSGDHGGLPGELGEFVGPMLGDNPDTDNIDMVTIFAAVRDSAAALSMHPQAHHEGPPNRNLVEETLKAINWCMERILDRTKTCSTAFFTWVHAVPPKIAFRQRPIRFPLRNEFMQRVIYHLLGDLVEIAENNANALHACMDPSSCLDVLSPLFHVKRNVALDYFDQEVANEITLAELQELFAGVPQIGPNIVPAGRSQPAPDAGDIQAAMSGIDLVQWFPGESEWLIFGKKITQLYKPQRIWQPEGATGTTEDVAPHNPKRTAAPITPG